ncbi:hypothetical protein INR49_031230 [Caranx melampygus]|nr:hypothetical protein INR49_031230 [Caranx melampygus]
MLLSSCHTMAVPPDFFLNPQTCRVMPIVGNVAYNPASSTLVFLTDPCTVDNGKWDIPLLPFIPYPTSRHSDQPLPSTRLKGLRPGQRLQLGVPMADPDTGVPVPILAVTIHPQTGLVYPLGGVHVCPITRLPQPIQIGYPMLDARTGNIVLTVGVGLDPATVMFKVLDLLKPLTEEWGSDPNLQHQLSHPGNERRSGQEAHLRAASKELKQAWGRSLHCKLQLQTRLEFLLCWAESVQQDGGIMGEMPLSGSDMCVPALLGMEYPDPMGSGLSVPVLGCQTDLISGIIIPLAGTMEDPDGKGLVAIRYGSQTIDPVTGVLAPVVGARLDVSRKNVLPVTASYWLAVAEQTDSVQVEALQREVCVRNIYWQHQRQREEDLLSDLDSALSQCLFRFTEVNSAQVQWSGRQLREAVVELQDSSQTEAQRRAAQHSHLALILPSHILHILTLGNEEEWEQQSVWLSEFLSGLDKVDVYMEQLQQDQEKWKTQGGDWATALHALDRELRQRDLWEQCCSRQTELEAALGALHFVRHVSQLHADTAQRGQAMGLLQHQILPLLERLSQLLEDKASFLTNTGSQHMRLHPVLEGTCQFSSVPGYSDTQLPRHTASSGIHSQEEGWTKLMELSPLFQLLRGMELQLKGWACGAGLLRGELTGGGKSFIDVLDAQWECEGELVPLDPSILNPREFLVYQHGLFLMHMLHDMNLTPAISLQIAASLPNNNYLNNAFRNSFFYQEAEERLFVRRQRLHSVGGFSLLLLHCLSHVKIKDMSSDSSPGFQRLFFKVLQACLGELFQARLGVPPSEQETNLFAGDSQEMLSDSCAASLLYRLHKPSRGLLSEDEVEELQMKLKETSLFSHLERLLREKNSTEKGGDQIG